MSHQINQLDPTQRKLKTARAEIDRGTEGGAMSKPVKLQVNATGAWRDVISWDAADDMASDRVVAAAEALGSVGRATCRIVMANEGGRSPTVLTHWTPESGWEER